MVMGRRRHVSGGHGAGESSAVRLPPTPATRTSNGPTRPCKGTAVGRGSVKKPHKRPRARRWWQDGTNPPRREQAPGRAERATGEGVSASSAYPNAATTGQPCQRRLVTSKKNVLQADSGTAKRARDGAASQSQHPNRRGVGLQGACNSASHKQIGGKPQTTQCESPSAYDALTAARSHRGRGGAQPHQRAEDTPRRAKTTWSVNRQPSRQTRCTVYARQAARGKEMSAATDRRERPARARRDRATSRDRGRRCGCMSS